MCVIQGTGMQQHCKLLKCLLKSGRLTHAERPWLYTVVKHDTCERHRGTANSTVSGGTESKQQHSCKHKAMLDSNSAWHITVCAMLLYSEGGPRSFTGLREHYHTPVCTFMHTPCPRQSYTWLTYLHAAAEAGSTRQKPFHPSLASR